MKATNKENDMAQSQELPQLSDLSARDMAEEMVLKFRRVAEDAYKMFDNLIYNKIRSTLSAPIIIAMKGDEATGRRLVAFYVASMLKCPLIKEHDFDNYKEKSEENQTKLWRNICGMALPQLTSGRCVVIDTDFSNQNKFDQLKELSKITNTPLSVFECRMEFVESLWKSLDAYEWSHDPVIYIFHEFVKKPVSQYNNSTNFDMGEIPIIVVEKEEDHGNFSRSVCNALMDLRAYIFPTFRPQNNRDCDHVFQYTYIKDEYRILCCQCRKQVSGSVYRCKKCRIIFHKTCSYFAESLWVPDGRWTLYLRDAVMDLDLHASCNCCKQLIRSSTSSRYYSTIDGRNLFDLECLFLLPAKLTTKLHKHELERTICGYTERCTECDAIIDGGSLSYKCPECPTRLDVYCLWLPETAQANRDRHPLKLSVIPRADPDPYYCHGCENERDTDKWIYYCEECDFQIHPRCIVIAPCLPRFLSTEISTTKKKLVEKLTDMESHSCDFRLSAQQEIPLRVKSEAEELGVLFKESTKEIKLPLIIMLKGHSTGRKLVASTLAATFSCLLIDQDTLYKITSTASEPELVCYREFSQIALSQLQIALSVVIDCDVSHESEFSIMRDFAFATRTPLFVVEFKPSDENKRQDFHDYECDVGDTPKISVDVSVPNFDHIDKSVPRILQAISAYCKEFSKEHTQEGESRSCYRHILYSPMKVDDYVLEGDICNRCSKQLLNPVLRCMRCPSVLHKACTKLPLHIKFNNQPFNLIKYGNDNNKVRCDCCYELVKDHSYIYYSKNDSSICLDLNCLLTPPELGLSPHEHPLDLQFNADPFQCGACGSTRKHVLSYACKYIDCEFKIGVKCSWLKELVPFDRHRHPFYLITSPEHISNQYYCEVCQEERDKNHWVYCCVECDYFIHVRCLVPETECCLLS